MSEVQSVNAFRVHGLGTQEKFEINFRYIKICGTGNFSSVFQSELLKPEQRLIAIKHIWDDKRTSFRNADSEIGILASIRHDNISNLLYYFSKQLDNKWLFCLVLEYLPQNLMQFRMNSQLLSRVDIQLYTWQLLSAISYLHSQSIIHLDIKPSNVILDHTAGVLKLTDFGNSYKINSLKPAINSYQVTRYYRPPELLFGSLEFSTAIDVWSVGCVLFEMITNRILFKGTSTEEQMEIILDIYGYPSSDDIKTMKISRPRIAKRKGKGLEQFLGNSVWSEALSLLKEMLCLNPSFRITASDALKHVFFQDFINDVEQLREAGLPIPELVKTQILKGK